MWRSLLNEHDPIDAARVFCRVLRRVHDVGVEEAGLECLRGEAGWRGARAPPPTATSPSFEVPRALRVDVETSSLTIYDALLGSTP